MSKKKIIIAGAIAAVSFALAMGAAFLLPGSGGGEALADANAQAAADANEVAPVQLSLQEKDLKELVQELKQRIADCRARTQQLNEREKQIRIIQDQLNKQAQELEDMRVKAASALAALRQEKATLVAERVKIDAEDKTNLKKTALIYQKMDAEAGGQILADMCRQNNEDAVVRILYYMDERSAAKTLEALSDRALAAKLCDKIKRVREQ